MCFDVDLLAARQLRLHLLSQDSGDSKTLNQLLAPLGALIHTALVSHHGAGDVAVPSGAI